MREEPEWCKICEAHKSYICEGCMEDINNGLKGIPKTKEVATAMVEAQKIPSIHLSMSSSEKEIAVANTQALETIAQALNQLSTFVAGGGLGNLLQGYARSQSVTAILGGLASHDGRKSLDARVLDQNALEMPYAIEKIFKQFAVHLQNADREIIKPPEEDPGNRYFMEVDGKQVEVDKKGNPIVG